MLHRVGYLSKPSIFPLQKRIMDFAALSISSKAASSDTAPKSEETPAPLQMIDIGANLADDVYDGSYHGKQRHEGDLPAVLQRGFSVGVERVLITGTTLAESEKALKLSRKHENVYCTVGVHPTRCNEFLENEEAHMQALLELVADGMRDGKVVAIGECGLDYDRTQFCEPEVQKTYFQKQFMLAEKTKLPMFLHSRNCHVDMIALLRSNYKAFEAGSGVVHSFDGSLKEAEEILQLGLSIGINGCSLKTQENLDVVAALPLDRLMIETDAPYCEIKRTHASYSHVNTKTWPWKQVKKEKWLPGCTVKGRNEVCNLLQVLEVVADLHQQDVSTVAPIIYANTRRVFGL